MDAYLASALAGIACSQLLLLFLLVRRSACDPAPRDTAWRDRLPWSLQLLQPLIRWYARGIDRSLAGHRRDVLQARLSAAGASYLIAPAEFLVLRRCALCIGSAGALFALLTFGRAQPVCAAAAAALGSFACLYPDLRLREATRQRQAHFEKEFPFLLDLLALSMKAGLTFTAAVEQAVEQLRDGPARQEFARYLREIRAGATRRAALDHLAARVATAAAASFAASVAQAEETGGSLGTVLAEQARQRRQERFLRAEKLANQAPVKMLFPLIALLFPVTFIIIGFPIAVQLIVAGGFL